MVIKRKRSSYGGSEFPTGRSGWGLGEQLDEIVRRHHLAAQISAAARPRPRSGLAMKGRAECYEVGEPLGDEPVAALCIHHDVGDQRSPEDRPEMAEHAVAHQPRQKSGRSGVRGWPAIPHGPHRDLTGSVLISDPRCTADV